MATYPAPDNRGNPIFNPIQFHTIGTSGQDTQGTGITQAEADARYLFLGNTQGAEQFQYDIQVNKGASFNQTTAQPVPLTINNLGKTATLTIDAASNLNLTTNQFGTGLVVRDTVNNIRLKPTNTGLSLQNYDTGAVTGLSCGVINCTDVNINGADLAQLGPTGTTQTFLNYNIFQGTNTSGVGTAPLTITNVDTGLYSAVYQDHNNNDQLTILSNTALGGLTLRNATGNSFTVYPAGANNAATFINPINVINNLGVTCGSLTLSNAGNTSALSTTATGLNVSDPIVSTGNVTSTGFVISDGVDNIYSLYSQNGYGFVVANQNGLGTLSLSNGGASVSTITCTAVNALSFGASSLTTTGTITGGQLTITSGANSTALTTTSTGLTCNDSITIPAQTYPLASSNIASTISYVNQAIASQGSGDVTQSGDNAFTGTNSFSQVPTTSVTQTAFNTTSTQLASIGYITSFVYNNTQSVPLGPISILLQGGNYYTYSNSYYQTGVIGKSVFSLSTSGRATFSFSAQPNPQNAYSNNNAYLQLLSPTWGGSPTSDAYSISNGAQNPILLGIWNSIQSIGKFSWPFNPTTLSQINQYGQTFVSNVLYYPTNTTYSQVYRAYVSVFTANDNSQNVALYVYPPFNGIGAQLAVQICPFTFSFG